MPAKKLPKSADLASSQLKDLAIKLDGRFPKAEEVQQALGIPLLDAQLLVREALQRGTSSASGASAKENTPKAKAKTSAKKLTAAEKKAAKAKAAQAATAAAEAPDASQAAEDLAGLEVAQAAAKAPAGLLAAQPATPEASASKRAAANPEPPAKRCKQLALTFPSPKVQDTSSQDSFDLPVGAKDKQRLVDGPVEVPSGDESSDSESLSKATKAAVRSAVKGGPKAAAKTAAKAPLRQFWTG